MATNFSPCKGSYVLNQFPSNVMFGMNGFHVSASGAIQGHHGPLVEYMEGNGEKAGHQFCFRCLPRISTNAEKFENLCEFLHNGSLKFLLVVKD